MLESLNDPAEEPMDFSKYTREQLLAALNNEYEYLCHDNFVPDDAQAPISRWDHS